MADLPKIDFDVAGAREAGFTDAAIADYLGGKVGYDVAGARKAGFANDDIISHLAPPPAPAPAPAAKPEPEPPPSGTLKGMGKAAAQTLGEIPGGIESGAGVAAKIAGRFEGRESALDIGLMRRLDQGEDFPSLMKAAPTDLARVALRQYQIASPEEKAQMRQSAINVAAGPPGALERGGANLIAAGQSKTEAVRKTIPLTPEEEQRPSVQFTRALTGLVGYIGAAAAGGFPAVIGYAGMDAMGKTYEEAKAKGAPEDQALGSALVDGMVQGGLMTVPVGQAMNVFNKLSGPAKTKFIEGAIEAAKSGVTLTAFSQISQIADNAVAQSTYDPDRKLTQGLGEHLGPTFAAGAVLPVAGAAAARAFRPRPRPEPAATPAATEPPPAVMAAPNVDQAIEAARETVNRTPVDVPTEAAGLREFGNAQDRQQAGILQLFGGLNAGTVERSDDGNYHYATEAGSFPLKPWDGVQRDNTIPTALAEAQRTHYDRLGVKVVYFENDARVPFDGAVDPTQPDTIFLSNNPQRNAVQVGAHEMTHILEGTMLPDGTSLADVLHQQVREGVTPEGMTHARALFLQTAPERSAFPAGQEGDADHSSAVLSHFYRELGADIGGEAPKFQSFLPRVVDAVQARYGASVAKDILKKLVDGIRNAVRTLRSFFDPNSEYGQAPTESQKWVRNLDAIHDTLAKMYAERYGEPLPQLAAVPAAKPEPAKPPQKTPEVAERETALLAEGRQPQPTLGRKRTPEEATAAGVEWKRIFDEHVAEGMSGPAATVAANKAVPLEGVQHFSGTDIEAPEIPEKATKAERDEIERRALSGEPAKEVEPVEPAAKTGLPAGPLTVRVGGKDYPVSSLQEASEKVRAVIDQMGIGNRDYPGASVHQGGQQIGYVAYNGRVFPGRAEDFKPGTKPIYEVPGRSAPTQLQTEQAKVKAMKERKAKPAEPAAKPSPEVAAAVAEVEPGLRDMAQRQVNAENNMVETIMERGELTRPQAEEAFKTLQAAKGLKRDIVGGRYTVKHGGMLDRDFLRKAAGLRLSGPEEIGKNYIGQALYEDERGVRSIIENGVRRTEPVGIKPGSREISVDRSDRPAYLLAKPHPTRPDLKPEKYTRPKDEVIPPPPEAKPEPKPVSPDAREAQPDHQMADALADMLDRSEGGTGGVTGRLKLAGKDVQALADRIYGGTLAEGKYTRDRLYDAMELGVNRFIQRHPERFSPTVGELLAVKVARDLANLKDSLPTQTVRAGEKDTYQQFSTPPDYAYAANWVANLKPADHVLEPSAGVGGLIVHAMNAGVRETTVNELSDKRRGMISALEPTRTTGEDAAQLHNILPGEVRPTVVVMNPPFSRAAERMGNKMVLDEGAKHIEQALSRLEPGGRLVAIVGDGMKPEGTVTEGYSRDRGKSGGMGFRDWWQKIGAEYDVRANIGVDRGIYSKYGTAFPTRLLVIDKNPPSGRELVTGQAKDAAGIIDLLQGVHDDRSSIQQSADESVRPSVAQAGEGEPGVGGELRDTAGGVGTGQEPGGRAEPAVAEPAGTAQSGVGRARPAGGRAERRRPVVPVEPEPVAGRAAGEPQPTARPGEEPAGSGAGRGGDGIRPDGSGERDEPGVTPAPEDVLATENAVARPGEGGDAGEAQGVSEAVYEAYKPQRVQITGAKAHPGALVQSAAMAAVLPPKTDYKPRLPAALVKSGALSDAQLESIVYAGHAHSDVMPDGRRRGFFIGDGTGVGKGREIAGILLDNKQNGRTKAVWLSEKRALINDARRDWNGLGQPASDLIDVGKTKAGENIPGTKGILFTTYDTLKSAEQTKVEGEKVRGRERIDQIIDWLGPDFDGVIAFDEAHNLGNATDEKGTRGVKKASAKALAGVALQERLPNARVVYVSATGATEITNLAYADRLGLWGEGTAFPNRNAFVGKVSEGGMAAMELVARDMKALGHYIARNLSYDGVSYERVEHKLSAEQRGTYDKLAEGWQVTLRNFNEALEMTGVTKDGKTLSGKQKSAMLSAYWGGMQRFFNQVITAMQMPSVIKGVEKDLKEGRQAVLQLVNTMEAAQERALEKARKSGEGEIEDLDMTPRDQLMQMVERSFPVQQMEEYRDDNGNIRSRPAKDSGGNPIISKEAVAKRDRLLDELGSLRVPEGPLEILLNHFGTEKVAEVTGRGQRVVRKPNEEGRIVSTVEKRGAQANIADAEEFQAGKKPILVFSEAGGTGRSYHAAIGSGSENARRAHYLVQGGWRADKAVQGFGRTHRTNQASAPIFKLVTTDLRGQMRFISSIARRLGQLGALTKGERRTGDQGMFGTRDNLESTEAKDALRQFFKDVNSGQVEGVTMTDLEHGMGLKMRDDNGALTDELPKMSQFLNRVLALKVDRQNEVFEAFSSRLDDVIQRAAAAGTLDAGVETYKADKISKVSEQTVYTDPRSGAETKHVHLNAQTRNHPVGFDDTLAGRNKTNGQKPDTFIQNTRSGKVFAVTRAGDRTDTTTGAVTPQVRLTSQTDYQFVDREKISQDNWKKLSENDARPLWEKQVADTPEFRNSALHLITGAVLPIWDRIGGSPKIYRLATDTNERMLGRVIPATQVDATLQRLGAEGVKMTETPGEVAERVLRGATAELANEWKIKSSRVAGENRIELVGPDYRYNEELERHGVFSERIQYKTRYFIPTEPGKAAAAIEAITKTRPVTALSDEATTAFSPRLTGESGREYTPEEREAFANVGRVTEPQTLRQKIDAARDDIGRKLVRETLDSYIGLKANDPGGYMAARLANSVAGAQETFLKHGTLKFDGAAYNYRDLNGGVEGFVKSLGPEAHDFLWWVAAHRAERLKAEDRENLFSDQDIETLKDLNRGELEQPYTMSDGHTTQSREVAYADALQKYDTLNKSVTDLVKESGLVPKKDEAGNELWADPFYVPFFREAATEGTTRFAAPTSSMVKQYASKRLKGGGEKLRNDLWGNALGNWDHMIDAALRNRAAAQILETASKDALGAAEKVSTQQAEHQMTKAERAETVWAMVDGKRQYYRVTDPMTFRAVSALETTGKPGPIMAVAKWFSKALRYGVTANPIFAVRNIERDTENSLAVSNISLNPVRNLADGFAMIDTGGRLKNLARAMAGKELETLQHTPEYVSALAGGALMRLGSASDAGIPKTDLRNILDSPNKLRAFGRYIADVADAYKENLASGEEVNRLALYHQLREQGAPHDFAAFSGRDLQDFTLHGASPFVRTITDITPFLGARLQGFYKLGRAFNEGGDQTRSRIVRMMTGRTIAVMGAMTLAGLALDAIYHDDEDYKKRTEYDRQTYYWFKIGDAQFRIPKGFELAALSSLAADGVEAFFDKEMTGKRVVNNFWLSLGSNLQAQAPAIIQPVIDIATNTRGTGGPIESAGMERLEPQQRYTAGNTLIARGLSSAINAGLRTVAPRADGPSPVQLDYLTNAYGGWLATTVLSMADTVARSASSEPERPASDFLAKATQGLVRTDTAPQSRYVDMLYEQGKQIEEAHATFLNLVKLGRGEEARAFVQDRREELAKYPMFERVKLLEGQINQQVRVIENSTTMSAEQKKIKIMQLQSLKNRAAQQLFEAAP